VVPWKGAGPSVALTTTRALKGRTPGRECLSFASRSAQQSRSVTDGTVSLGIVTLIAGRFAAFDVDASKIGQFASLQRPSRAFQSGGKR
jgi:hypothetical protein